MRSILKILTKKKEKMIKELEGINIKKLDNQYSKVNYLWALMMHNRNPEILKAVCEHTKEEKNKKAMAALTEEMPLFTKMKKIDAILSKHHRIKEIEKGIRIVKGFLDRYDALN